MGTRHYPADLGKLLGLCRAHLYKKETREAHRRRGDDRRQASRLDRRGDGQAGSLAVERISATSEAVGAKAEKPHCMSRQLRRLRAANDQKEDTTRSRGHEVYLSPE